MGIKGKENKVEGNEFSFAVHPGTILKKYLRNIKMTQRELSKQTSINKTIINEIIKRKRKISLNIAMRLEKIFKLPPKFWCGLQAEYDEAILRLKNNNCVKLCIVEDVKINHDSFKKVKLEIDQEISSCAV